MGVTPIHHKAIDARLLELLKTSIQEIDANPALRARLAENVSRWSNTRLRTEWQHRLQQPWATLRAQLLAETEQGSALRQNAPLAGILSPTQRTRIMREFSRDATSA